MFVADEGKMVAVRIFGEKFTSTLDGIQVTGYHYEGKIYVDDVLKGYAIGYNENLLYGDEGISIGRYGGNYFNGAIDDVILYNRALTSGEISGL